MANAPLILTSTGGLKELPLVTTVGATGSDAAIPTEQAVREALSAHSHAYADITNKPTTFAPSAHSHAYADITNKPTTFAPSAHSHAVTAYVRYTGNGAASRVLTLSASIMPAAILIMRDDAGMVFYWLSPLGAYLGSKVQLFANAISVTAGTVTLTTATGNGNGLIFSLIAWGNAV